MTDHKSDHGDIQGGRERAVADRLSSLAAATPVNEDLRAPLWARLLGIPRTGLASAPPRSRFRLGWRPRALVAAVTVCALLAAAVLLMPGPTIATASAVEAIGSTELLRLTEYDGFLSVASAGPRAVVEKNEALWLLGSDGSLQPLFQPPQGQYARGPAVSPDGKRLAFAHSVPGAGAGISLADISGTGLVQVTISQSELVYDSEPAWSPDGTKLAFTRAVLTGMRPVTVVETVMVVNADGCGAEPAEFATGSHPTWSPDGAHLVYSRPEAGTDGGWAATELVIARVDGTGERILGRGSHPAWSPAGQFVAYARTEGTERVLRSRPDGTPWLVVQEWSREIWAVNVLSGEHFQLTASVPAPGFDLAAWQREAEAQGPPDTGQIVAVVEGGYADWGPAWGKDGKTLLFVRSAQSSWASTARFSVCQLTLRFR